MAYRMTRRTFFGLMAATGAATMLAGCSSSGSGSAGSASGASRKVTIGSLATEDILPMWVAQEEGLIPAGYSSEVVVFQSATELMAGVASGEVDIAMTDIMVSASLFAGGAEVKLDWITLGATAAEGRFGIMVGPDSDVQTLGDLAGVPIGVGSNTILEYVMDRLMEDAGIPESQIIVNELPKLPVRYQLMLEGEVAAAALPASLLALGEAQGCRTIADDTKGDNISQSVMISRVAFADSEGGEQALEAMKAAWDAAVDKINADPEKYRPMLVANTNLPETIADTYPISTYPKAQLPSAAVVDPVLAWAQGKGYLSKAVSYDEATGRFA